jgi:hypothetical protein
MSLALLGFVQAATAGAGGIAGRVEALEAAVAALQSQATTLPPPAYDSGWRAIAQTATLVLQHNLGTSTDKMVVDLQFRASAVLGDAGINNEFYGTGYTFDGFKGAYWLRLTQTSIALFREADDDSAEQVRVRIWLHR